MNRFNLCNKLLDKTGIQGGDFTTTLNQTGERGRVVKWIDEAYNIIQASKATWLFLRATISVPLVSATQEYSDSSVARWITEDCRIYSTDMTDEQRIEYLPWDTFRAMYLLGTQRTQTGRPYYFSIKPDAKLIFAPIPDQSYTFNSEAYSVPNTMTADMDIPVFPLRFHDIIVWKALMIYAGEYTSEADKYDVGRTEYKKLFKKLCFDQLERPFFGEPLA